MPSPKTPSSTTVIGRPWICGEMTWAEFTATPSRLTAEPVNREERARTLHRVAAHGFVADYQGVRISRTGRRFLVEQATVWNVLDGHGTKQGQAAAFSRWTRLDTAVHL